MTVLVFERYSRDITRLCECAWRHVTDPETGRIAGWRVTEFVQDCPVRGHHGAWKAARKQQATSALGRAA